MENIWECYAHYFQRQCLLHDPGQHGKFTCREHRWPNWLLGKYVNGTVGKNVTNAVTFSQSFSNLFIPSTSTSLHTVPIDFIIPPNIDKQALADSILLECITNHNQISTLMNGNATVSVLSLTFLFSFGPQYFFAPCIWDTITNLKIQNSKKISAATYTLVPVPREKPPTLTNY